MKFKVLKTFHGQAESKTFGKGSIVDVTKKRAEEVNDKLAHLGVFLERVEEPKKED